MKSIKLLLHLFWLFFKVGAVTFGGGVTMAPILMKEVVEKRNWLTEADLVECFALAQSLPGVVAVNAAVYVGYKKKGATGAAVSAVASVIPAVLGILAFVSLLEALPLKYILEDGMKGIKSASVALVICTVIRMGKSILSTKLDKFLFAAVFAATMFFDANAILLLILFALLGAIHYFILKRKGRHV